ncbi:hypothetical protein EV426DRAFT_609163 [Tirmania nivea]|nr:hypothetical protein EV426DRAFT_609163 [Tirmania nivea]
MSSTSIGSAAWLRQERSSINRLYGQDVEDFTFSARQEMDWLNEHMEEVFAASIGGVDIAELLKTPARSAKKAVLGESVRKPGSAKKRVGEALKGKFTTSVGNVINSMPPPPQPAKASPPLITHPATGEEEAPVQPVAEPENTHIDIENQATQEDSQMPLSVPASQRTHAHPSRRVSIADTFRDSGNWSQSSGVPSQQHQRIMARPRSPRKTGDCEPAVVEGEDEADISIDMGRKSIASATYHTANEEEEEEREGATEADAEQDQNEPGQEQEASMVSFGQSSPFQEHVEGMPQGKNSRDRSSAHSANMASSPLRVLPVIEKRRSGRGSSDAMVKNVEEAEELQVQQEEIEEFQVQENEVEVEGMDIHPPSSPPIPVETVEVTKKRVSNRQQTPPPVKEVEQLPSSPVPAESEHQDEEHPLSSSSGSPAPTDEDSLVPTFLRKSSFSFASLPPRGRLSATATETVKLGGAGRSSWLQGRRTLGRSLVGRLIMPEETLVVEGSKENASATEKPRERKRSRGGEERDAPVGTEKAQEEEEHIASKGSRKSNRKKSRSASYKSSDEELAVLSTQGEEVTTQGEEMDTEDDIGSKVAEHNKSASQRLQERIQQLGKLNSSTKTTTSLSSAQEAQLQVFETAEPMYPDLSQAKEASKSRTSAPQEHLQQQQKQQNSRSAKEPSVEEDDWIPPVRSASVRTVAANKSSTNLGRSKTVPVQSTPGTKNQALRDGLKKKPGEQSFEDALQKKSSRGELSPSGRPNLPQSLAFNAINSPHNIAPPAPTAGARFEDNVSIPLSPKLANKRSFVATSSSLQKSTTTEESPLTAAKNQTADALKRAKEMFIKTNVLDSRASTESLKSGSRLGHKPSLNSIGRSSSPRTPRGQISKQVTPNREIYPDLVDKIEEEVEVEVGVKSKRQMRGYKNKDMLQKQKEEETLAREAQEAQRLKEEEEQAQQAAAEEKARQEEKARLEEKRRLAEQRRKEKELQKQLAAQKKAEEEARIQREKEEREEEMRRHREELQRKEEELKRLMEEQRLFIQKREEDARLRQEQEEEMRRQEMERRRREEEEERARKEAEDVDARRIAEQEAEEETRKHAELEELRKKQDEDLRRKQDAERRKKESTPIQLESEEEVEAPEASAGNASISRIARPKSAMGGRPPSRLQPPSGGKRPLRQPLQKAERGKPTPVSIQVGTASQRAAMDRQKPAAPPSSTLLSAMKDTFAPKERPATAEPTLVQSNSAPNLKKPTSTQSIAASVSTSNLKKASTMDEKKREENRRLIEARREEIRRKEAAAAAAEEEKRKAQQGRRAMEREVEPAKKTMPKSMGTKGPATKITRVLANANLRKLAAASVEDVTIIPQQERESPDTEPSTKKGPKRAFNAEEEHPQTTTAAPTATGSTYGNRLAPPKMPDAKKRKTEEWELDNLPPPPTAPVGAPVRPSAAGARRDWPAKSTYVQGYTSAATAVSVAVPLAGGSGGSSGSGGGSGASTVKVATKAAASSNTITTIVPTVTPHIEGVKFSNDKIRLAADSTTTTPGPSHGPSKTPKEKSILKKSALKTPNDPQKRVFSPMKGDGIELPEIPTDSEDDYSTSPSDSDSDSFEGPSKSSRFPVPHWAASPELKQALVAQQTMDPEEVFGPIGPLQMEEIFRGSGVQGKARFRNRSSSANWSTGDKLTREEIERDREARVRMVQRGGWDMGVMPEGDEEGSSRK